MLMYTYHILNKDRINTTEQLPPTRKCAKMFNTSRRLVVTTVPCSKYRQHPHLKKGARVKLDSLYLKELPKTAVPPTAGYFLSSSRLCSVEPES